MSFYKKYLEFQKEISNPFKASTNPHFKSAFVELNDLLNHVKPVLNKHGLILQQRADEDYLITQIIDVESEQGITSKYKLSPDKQNLQGQGSARTYIRRYEIETVCGIFGDRDDDGNAGSEPSNDKGNPLLDKTRELFLSVDNKDPDALADYLVRNELNPKRFGQFADDKLCDVIAGLSKLLIDLD